MDDVKQKAWIGVDPGKSGAYALLRESGTADVFDWTDPKEFSDTISEWCENLDIQGAVVEAVHSMPKQGVSSSFAFGMVYGVAQGVIVAHGIPMHMVTPQKWQKALFSKQDGADTKTQSLAVARRLFPAADIRLKKHHGRSDAVLLAHYGFKYLSF